MSESEVNSSSNVEKLHMEWSNYDNCISYFNFIIHEKTKSGKKGSVVGIHRGSLGMAAHLSNLSELPMSIIKFQSYDGNDKEPILIWSEIEDGDIIFLCDDIIDTGNTIEKCIDFFKIKYPSSEVYPMALMGSDKKYAYCYEHNHEWVVFPWEREVRSRDEGEWEKRQAIHGRK
jgi:hypoxanthine phosphoribosyltransferase